MKSLLPEIPVTCVSFMKCAFHSEKFIALRNVVEDAQSAQLIVVNPVEKKTVMCKPIRAESVVMHPSSCCAAVRRECYFVML